MASPSATESQAAGNKAAKRRHRRRHAGYSSFVSLMKVVLPAVAIILVALIVVWPQIKSSDSRFKIGFARLKATESGDPSMINARFVGSDSDNQPFSITADLAKSLAKGNALVELEKPKADITVEDGTWLVLTANTGYFDSTGKSLDLVGSVNMFHDSGFEFTTKKAAIDLAGGVASGNDPIAGHGPFGSLRAEGFRLEGKGKNIFFTGKTKVVIFPGSDKSR